MRIWARWVKSGVRADSRKWAHSSGFGGEAEGRLFRSRGLKGGAIPVGAIGGGVIAALKKLEQGCVRVRGLAHVFVGQNEFTEVGIEAGLRGGDGILRVAGRLRVGVTVKERVNVTSAGAGCAGPESATADLVRI